MSYEKTTWETGDTITAEKLNKLENGVAEAGESGGVLVTFTVTMQDMYTVGSVVADKTYLQVIEAINKGSVVMAKVTGLPARDILIAFSRTGSNSIEFMGCGVVNNTMLSVYYASLFGDNTATYVNTTFS